MPAVSYFQNDTSLYYFLVAGTPSADSRTYLPSGGEVSAAEMEKLRASCAPLVQWLDSAEDDDDDDEEED